MLYLVPHVLVKRNYVNTFFASKSNFEQNGIFIGDGTAANNRDGYFIDAEGVRLFQYDSADLSNQHYHNNNKSLNFRNCKIAQGNFGGASRFRKLAINRERRQDSLE